MAVLLYYVYLQRSLSFRKISESIFLLQQIWNVYIYF